MASNFCSYCGEKLNENSCFCIYCGNLIKSNAEDPLMEVPVQSAKTNPSKEAAPIVFQSEPSDVPIKQPTENVPCSNVRTPGQIILIAVLCIFLLLFSLTSTVLTGLRPATSKNEVQSFIKETLDDLENIPVGDADFGLDLKRNASAMDVILAATEEAGLNLKRRDVKKFINKSEIIEETVSKLSCYIDDIRNGTSEALIDRDDVWEMIDDDRELLKDMGNPPVSDQNIDVVSDTVEASGILEYTNARVLRDELPGLYNGIQIGLSTWFIAGLYVLQLLILWAILKINRLKLIPSATDMGCTLAISGLLTGVVSIISPLIATHALEGEAGADLILRLLKHLVSSWRPISLVLLAGGILLVTISKIVKSILKKKREKQLASDAPSV